MKEAFLIKKWRTPFYSPIDTRYREKRLYLMLYSNRTRGYFMQEKKWNEFSHWQEKTTEIPPYEAYIFCKNDKMALKKWLNTIRKIKKRPSTSRHTGASCAIGSASGVKIKYMKAIYGFIVYGYKLLSSIQIRVTSLINS